MLDEKEERDGEYVTIQDFANDCSVDIVQTNKSGEMFFNTVNINRPGLLLAGFEDYFGVSRIQVIGNAEYYYLASCSKEEKRQKFMSLFKQKIPCVILSKNIEPTEELIEISQMYDVPVFKSKKLTSQLVNDLVTYLNIKLAPSSTIHGVLIEVSGIGVLITGQSGMGKSETAMELIHRGHRLIADDNVIAKRIQDEIIGTSPDKIRHFMEIRGVGIIDVRSMFGVGSVLKEKSIDLVIELEVWEKDKEYDRLGIENKFEDILGIEIPKLTMPVMPGRNLAIVVEVAARNERLKKLGVNAVEQLLSNIKFGEEE
ncbi:MAG: HPr(Ser) kinase/phosphatase [Clostridia bacterium]|nr:HPr(Ser) kinase/phosphatase [Clostridia bacterium]